MKYIFLFLAVIMLNACKVNGKNRIRFVDMEQDAAAQKLWRPDDGGKEEDIDADTDTDIRDARTSECTNSCYARFGCHSDTECLDLLVTCLLDCGEEIFPRDAQ